MNSHQIVRENDGVKKNKDMLFLILYLRVLKTFSHFKQVYYS